MALFKKQITWLKLLDSAATAKANMPLNKPILYTVGNKRLCVVNTNEGFFAIDDKCPHNGASLSGGWCTEDHVIICPVHRYSFDLKTGRAKSGFGEYVQTYPVEIRNDEVFVGFEERVWNLF